MPAAAAGPGKRTARQRTDGIDNVAHVAWTVQFVVRVEIEHEKVFALDPDVAVGKLRPPFRDGIEVIGCGIASVGCRRRKRLFALRFALKDQITELGEILGFFEKGCHENPVQICSSTLGRSVLFPCFRTVLPW